jgi:hypothetical protein
MPQEAIDARKLLKALLGTDISIDSLAAVADCEAEFVSQLRENQENVSELVKGITDVIEGKNTIDSLWACITALIAILGIAEEQADGQRTPAVLRKTMRLVIARQLFKDMRG